MTKFAMPRTRAAILITSFCARTVRHVRRACDRSAALLAGRDRDTAFRERIHLAHDVRYARSSSWILHAR